MRNGFIDTIVQKETEIRNLKNKIKSFGHLLQIITNIPNGPTLTDEKSFATNFGIRSRDTITSCYIIGDSHVRDLWPKMSQLLPFTCIIKAFVQGGADFREVAQTHINSPVLIHSNLESVIISRFLLKNLVDSRECLVFSRSIFASSCAPI